MPLAYSNTNIRKKNKGFLTKAKSSLPLTLLLDDKTFLKKLQDFTDNQSLTNSSNFSKSYLYMTLSIISLSSLSLTLLRIRDFYHSLFSTRFFVLFC